MDIFNLDGGHWKPHTDSLLHTSRVLPWIHCLGKASKIHGKNGVQLWTLESVEGRKAGFDGNGSTGASFNFIRQQICRYSSSVKSILCQQICRYFSSVKKYSLSTNMSLFLFREKVFSINVARVDPAYKHTAFLGWDKVYKRVTVAQNQD